MRTLAAIALVCAAALAGCGSSSDGARTAPTASQEPTPQTITELQSCLGNLGVKAQTNGSDNLLVTGGGPDDKFLVSTAAIDQQFSDAGDWWTERFPAGTRDQGLEQAASYLAAGIDLNSAAELAAHKRVSMQTSVDYGGGPESAPLIYPRYLLASANRTLRAFAALTPGGVSNTEDLATQTGLSVDAVQTAFDYRRYGRSLKMLERPSPEATFERGQYGNFLVLYRLSPDAGALSATINSQFETCLPGWKSGASDDSPGGSSTPSSPPASPPQESGPETETSGEAFNVCGYRSVQFDGATVDVKLDAYGDVSCDVAWEAAKIALGAGPGSSSVYSGDFQCQLNTNQGDGALGGCEATDGSGRFNLLDVTGIPPNSD